jgi:REP element-mobilizing transposase RayT
MGIGDGVLIFYFFQYNYSMRQSRCTWPGAFHHIMNRGDKGEPIFRDDTDKLLFLKILTQKHEIHRIRIFAYCLMDTHYHLVVENRSGKMGDFLRQVNGHYAMLYRRKHGGKGYVFQGRYRSQLIENDSYLMQAIIYVLANPLRSGLYKDIKDYSWSSFQRYYQKAEDSLIDNRYIEELFGNAFELEKIINSSSDLELQAYKTRLGKLIGGKDFFTKAIKKYNRRHHGDAVKKMRRNDFYFDTVEKVLWEFKQKYGIEYDELDITTHKGKRLRGELLILLKDRAGLTYSQISEFSIFSSLKFNSLGHLYRNAHERKIKKLKPRP